MTQFHIKYPLPIKEIVTTTEFYQDEDLQEKIIDSKMTHDYVVLMFICSLLLIVVVLL